MQETITQTAGTYKSTISFVSDNGYGTPEYRVKVTYNSGENMAFLKGYKTLNAAKAAAKRELHKIAA